MAQRNRQRILAIERDAGHSGLMRRLSAATSDHFELRYAASLSQGWDAVRSTTLGAVLLDLELPESTGVETLRRWLRRPTSTPVVVLTECEEAVAAECLRLGAQDCLGKRAGVAAIARALRHAIARAQAPAPGAVGPQLFSLAFENAPFGMAVIDSDLRFLRVNTALCETFGYCPQEFAALSVPDLGLPAESASGRRLAEHCRRGGTRPRMVKRCCAKKDGEPIWLEITSSALHHEGREPTLGLLIFHDLSARREILRQLHHAQKMEAVGQLAGGVAQDFNNLLTVILAGVERIREQAAPGDRVQQPADQIKTAAESASLVVRRLLAFGRKQVLESRRLSLNKAVSDAAAMLQRLIGENIELICRLVPEPHLVEADPGQIEQVIINLVLNARDAMPGGGKILLETENVDLDRPRRIAHGPVEPGLYAALLISDSGMGMDAATQARIFEPFFTTKPEGRGTGLGLSTVYGIVKQSGGHIELDSEPGCGSTFKIYLPSADRPAAAGRRIALRSPRPRPDRGTETVLLVEDQDELRELIHLSLENRGYRVLAAPGGDRAFEICAAYQAPIHLLITDVVMPDLSGPELARRFSRLYPEAKLLYVSGYTDAFISNRDAIPQSENFLQKPFTGSGLAARVREILDRPAGAGAAPLPMPGQDSGLLDARQPG